MGTTVLAVLHDLNVVAASCPRLVLLAEGRVVADGSPEAVLTPVRIREIYQVSAFAQGRSHAFWRWEAAGAQ